MSYTPVGDFFSEVALGQVVGYQAVTIHGVNESINTNNDEDIFETSGANYIYPWPTVAQTHDVVSSSVGDNQVVRIIGLAAGPGYGILTEQITLNGTTPVTTVNSYFRINYFFVQDVTSPTGTVTATGNTDGTITSRITPGNGQSQQAIYTVPGGYTATVERYFASVNKKNLASVDASLFIREPAYDFRRAFRTGGHSQGSSFISHRFTPSKGRIQDDGLIGGYAAGTDFKVQGSVTQNDSSVSAGFDLLMLQV